MIDWQIVKLNCNNVFDWLIERKKIYCVTDEFNVLTKKDEHNNE